MGKEPHLQHEKRFDSKLWDLRLGVRGERNGLTLYVKENRETSVKMQAFTLVRKRFKGEGVCES